MKKICYSELFKAIKALDDEITSLMIQIADESRIINQKDDKIRIDVSCYSTSNNKIFHNNISHDDLEKNYKDIIIAEKQKE